jgi:DNA transposition AAA+ family ATPase
MINNSLAVNPRGTVAILKNVAACMEVMDRLRNRGPGRPGLGVFYGHSGYGKTYSAIYVQNKTKAARVEVGDSWSRKVLLEKICQELHVEPRGTIAQLTDRVVETLVDDDRPLIIDEADKLCDKNMIEIVRQIQEESGAPVLLLGEEKLPAKISLVERVHNRVLVWEPAEPSDLEDTRALAKLLCPSIAIADDLLERIRRESQGRARRIVVNLDLVTEAARNMGVAAMCSADFEGRFYTGALPKMRGA